MLDNKNSRLKDEQLKVLLSRKLWERAQSKEERKRSIARYIQTGYPNYRIEKVVMTRELPSNLQEEIDMSRLLLEDEPLVVLPKLATVIGLNEAIILQQLHYWLEKVTT